MPEESKDYQDMEHERLKRSIECMRNSQEAYSYDETTVEHAVVTPILIISAGQYPIRMGLNYVIGLVRI